MKGFEVKDTYFPSPFCMVLRFSVDASAKKKLPCPSSKIGALISTFCHFSVGDLGDLITLVALNVTFKSWWKFTVLNFSWHIKPCKKGIALQSLKNVNSFCLALAMSNFF